VERNQQVAIMADVYRKADSVIIWLGQSSGLVPAMQFLSFLDTPRTDIFRSEDSSRCCAAVGSYEPGDKVSDVSVSMIVIWIL
jgi:hypothetical protein